MAASPPTRSISLQAPISRRISRMTFCIFLALIGFLHLLLNADIPTPPATSPRTRRAPSGACGLPRAPHRPWLPVLWGLRPRPAAPKRPGTGPCPSHRTYSRSLYGRGCARLCQSPCTEKILRRVSYPPSAVSTIPVCMRPGSALRPLRPCTRVPGAVSEEIPRYGRLPGAVIRYRERDHPRSHLVDQYGKPGRHPAPPVHDDPHVPSAPGRRQSGPAGNHPCRKVRIPSSPPPPPQARPSRIRPAR